MAKKYAEDIAEELGKQMKAVSVAEFFKNPTDFDVEAVATVMMPNESSVIIANNYADMYMIHHVHNE